MTVDIFKKRVYARSMSPCYCSLLRAANRRIGAVYDDALAPLGINIAQYSLLRAIERLQPVSLTELGGEAELDRSTIGRNVRVLERMGLVETGRGEADHREAVVTLASRGVDTLFAAGPVWKKCQREIETLLGPVKVTALQEILRSI
jgi:DNA-binding MarR family transcriptional regulator